MSTVEAMILID